jgi:hypothetical protein
VHKTLVGVSTLKWVILCETQHPLAAQSAHKYFVFFCIFSFFFPKHVFPFFVIIAEAEWVRLSFPLTEVSMFPIPSLALLVRGLIGNITTLAEIQRWAEIHDPELKTFRRSRRVPQRPFEGLRDHRFRRWQSRQADQRR